LLAAVLLLGACDRAAATPGPVDVRLTIHHSRFAPEHLSLARGATVRFTVVNTDPIDHELIVGDDATQNLHEFGTDRAHDAPGAVTVPAGATRTTEIVVRDGYSYGCHLPGHFNYGMKGTISLRS
jgi:uncharacterized cupredoxin-like copper-binding protein